MKRCKDCGEVKSLDQFYRNAQKNFYQSYCKVCHGHRMKTVYRKLMDDPQTAARLEQQRLEAATRWRDRNRDVIRERYRRRYATDPVFREQEKKKAQGAYWRKKQEVPQ